MWVESEANTMSRGEFIFSTSRGETGLMVSGHMEKGEGGGWGEGFTNLWGLQLNSPLLGWFGRWITNLLPCSGAI